MEKLPKKVLIKQFITINRGAFKHEQDEHTVKKQKKFTERSENKVSLNLCETSNQQNLKRHNVRNHEQKRGRKPVLCFVRCIKLGQH